MAFTEKYVSALAGGSGNGNSEGTAYTFAQMVTEILSVTGTGGEGKRYNVKADGTYTRSATDDLGPATGTNSVPLYIRGYKTTIGDGYLGRTGGNGALITTNMPLIDTGTNQWKMGKFMVVESLRWTGSPGDYLLDCSQNITATVGCSVANAHATGGFVPAFRIREGSIAFECDFSVSSI